VDLDIVTPSFIGEMLPAVFACVSLIAETISSLKNNFEIEIKKQTKFCFFESLITEMLLFGESFAVIYRNANVEPVAIEWISKNNVTVNKNLNGRLIDNYTIGTTQFNPQDVLHLKYKTKDGLTGISPLGIAPSATKLAETIQNLAIDNFSSGNIPYGVLTTALGFRDNEARKNLVESFKRTYAGKNKIGLLEQGVEFKQIAYNYQQTQFAELKKMSTNEVASLFRVPLSLIQSSDSKESYNSLAVQSNLFLTFTLLPHLIRLQEECKKSLEIDLVFDTSSLAQADSSRWIEDLSKQIGTGLLTINEARELLGHEQSTDAIANKILISNNLRVEGLDGQV